MDLNSGFDILSKEAKGKYICFLMFPYLLRFDLFLELFLGENISELFEIPSSLEFLRDYVAKNLPVVIRNAVIGWPAVTKWNSKYFK